MMTGRTLCWFSCGAASAVATKLVLLEDASAIPVYCETGIEHPDNERFLADCERWFGKEVVRLRSDEYADAWDVWSRRKYLAGINGASCTVELKIAPRLSFQRPGDLHVFGYTADSSDITRDKRLRQNYFEMKIRSPLIERGITKAACLSLVLAAGVGLPVMYILGFLNNNCIPCVKATSANYWAAIRLHFPEIFWRMAKLARELDVRLCRINGERRFIDEIPADWPVTEPLAPACDFLCQLAEQDLEVAVVPSPHFAPVK